MRTPLVAGNWKMYKLVDEAVSTVNELMPLVRDVSTVEVVVCPPSTSLYAVHQAIEDSNIALGAQNCYCKENGAFTGEVSPQMLLDVGCAWSIIGHSERRTIFGEADALLNEKLHFALGAGLKVMYCIGETLDERESGKMDAVLTRQVTEGLKGLKAEQFPSVSVAYEPVWAIGTGKTATPDQAEEAHALVRGLVQQQFGAEIAEGLRIQYGGSVKPDNAAELMRQPNVDGALVGGASLNAEQFAAIVKAAQ